MVQFWSLSRSGLAPVGGAGSWRAFAAAVRSCGLPRFRVGFDARPGVRPRLMARVEFWSGPLFRCWFRVGGVR